MNHVEGREADPGWGAKSAWGWVWLVLRTLSVLIVLAVFGVAFLIGILFNALALFLMVMGPVTLLDRLWGAYRGEVELGWLRRPLGRESRAYLLQGLNRSMFWVMVAITLALCIVPAEFEPGEFLGIRVVIGVCLAIVIGMQLVPRRRVRLLGNIPYAVGWAFLAAECLRVVLPHPTSDGVVIDPPFRGEWLVMQGGRSALVNHHFPIQGQRYALDLVRVAEARGAKEDAGRLESYASYGRPLFAPAEGRVARVVNDRPDMAIGQTDIDQLVGNHVVFEVGKGQYVLMAHLMKGSIEVSEGERVARDRRVARCGNSGNTSEPHLHLQVQSLPDFQDSRLETFPILFRDADLVRWGRPRRGDAGDPRRNDRIRPVAR